jgi:hypothetical protein
MLFIIVLFCILITVFVLYRNGPALIAALSSIALLLILNNLKNYQRISGNEIVVFNVPGKILVALTQGIETFWLTSEKPGTWEKLNYYIKPYEGFRGIKKSSMICLSDSLNQTGKNISCRKNFLNFRGITLSFIDHTRAKEKDWEQFPVSDFIILSGRSQINTALVQRYHPKTVIIDTRQPLLPGNANSSPPTVSGNIKNLNTNQRGAVQIKFKPTANGEKINLRCEYFNQQ